MIYSVLLNPCLDVLYQVGEVVPGATITDVNSAIQPAGKGLNVARAVRTLGDEVCVCGLMPLNNRSHFESYCQAHHMQHAFYGVEGSARINASLIESKVPQVTHISAMSPMYSPRIQDELMEMMRLLMREGDFWVFSGSVPRGFESDVYQKMIQFSTQAGATVLLDTRGTALKHGVRAKPQMIAPNLAELEEFFGEPVEGIHHIILKGKRLVDMGISYVFITLGSDGMIALHENDCLLCSPPPVKVVDTVGCGDALVAGLVVGMQRRFSFAEMCRMAVACGASNAMHPGPGIIEREEVWQLMEEVSIENV